MLKTQLCVRTISGHGIFSNQSNGSCSFTNSLGSPAFHFSVRLAFSSSNRCRCPKTVLIFCKSSRGSRSGHGDHRDHEYLEASVLLPETISHYQTQREGFEKEMKGKSSGQLAPFPVQAKKPRIDVSSIRQEFLRRFQSPTIFLKISCDGDFLLPIVVGDFAIEKLIDTLEGDGNGDTPDQFQFMRDIVEKLGYKVKCVRITERVVNTYFARLYFSKAGQNDILSVDARPSDAINVACRCEVPIYVNKQIILTDAIRLGYGMGRTRDSKPIYDVSLDSAADGPDLLAEELDVVRNMNISAAEERYNDAAIWRDKLMKLRKPSEEQQ